MDLIRTSIGLTRTIKNVVRFKEIVTVFARNGFHEFIIKSGILNRVPNFVLPTSKEKLQQELEEMSSTEVSAILGFRLRKSFEELGPSFIKLGQLLSTREDIFPKNFIDQMKLLRDRVKGVPFNEVIKIIDRAYGRPWNEIFKSIEEIPVGTASIGVVHKGILLTGEEVVIKVRRPNIYNIIETDFGIMSVLIESVERVSEDIKYLGISKLITDFHTGLRYELDFNIENLNCKKISRNLAKQDKKKIFYIPKMYDDLIRQDVLVMEYLDGVPFSDAQKIKPHLETLTPMLTNGLGIFTKAILEDGFFHADLHGGNFFYLDKINKIGIIDFGLVGTMGRKAREHFVAIIYSLVNQNYENLVYEFLDVAEYERIPDIDALIRDVKDNISPYVGLTVQAMDFTRLNSTIIQTLASHRLYLPRDWYIVFRALMTMDGVGKSLGMDFDLLAIVEGDLEDIMASFTSKTALIEESAWAGRDILNSLRVLPRHLRWFVKEASKSNYQLNVQTKGYEKQLDRLSDSITFFAYCFLAAMSIYSGVHFVGDIEKLSFDQLPKLSLIFWSMGIFLFLRGIFIIRK